MDLLEKLPHSHTIEQDSDKPPTLYSTDRDVLLLKSISLSTIDCLASCYSILSQHQQQYWPSQGFHFSYIIIYNLHIIIFLFSLGATIPNDIDLVGDNHNSLKPEQINDAVSPLIFDDSELQVIRLKTDWQY